MIIDETPSTSRAIVPSDPLGRWPRGKFKPRFHIDSKGRALEVIDLREVERRLKTREVEDATR